MQEISARGERCLPCAVDLGTRRMPYIDLAVALFLPLSLSSLSLCVSLKLCLCRTCCPATARSSPRHCARPSSRSLAAPGCPPPGGQVPPSPPTTLAIVPMPATSPHPSRSRALWAAPRAPAPHAVVHRRWRLEATLLMLPCTEDGARSSRRSRRRGAPSPRPLAS